MQTSLQVLVDAQQQHFLGALFILRGRSFLLQPSLLAVASTEQGGVQEEMIPVWMLGMRCAQKAGAGTEAMQKQCSPDTSNCPG